MHATRQGRRHTLVRYAVILMMAAGCASRTTYTASLTPIPPSETMPVWRTERALAVGVDPYVQPERQQAVFDAKLHERGVLPIELFTQNQGDRVLRLDHGNIALEFPDGTQRHPL